MKVLLIDIDGVLVRPGGYRQAQIETIRYFSELLGFGPLQITEDAIDYCESLGITNEWDSIPLFLATLIESFLEEVDQVVLPADWDETEKIIRGFHFTPAEFNYQQRIFRVKQLLQKGQSQSVSLLEHRSRSDEQYPFPRFARQPFFETLFGVNDDIEKSRTTRYFQNLVIGSTAFCQTYHGTPPVTSPSYILEYDKALLEAKMAQRILAGKRDGNIGAVAYSARPSLPPREVETKNTHAFSPEAEMAVELVGLQGIPLIAYGGLLYLSQVYGLSTDCLLKPSPFQAVAAILAAISSNEWMALKLALQIGIRIGIVPDTGIQMDWQDDPANITDRLKNETIEIHIIEDTPNGLVAGQKACELLSRLGATASISLWGVAEQPVKRNALEACGAEVLPNINEVLEKILQ